MSAQPVHEDPDPRDPETILRQLPAKTRPKFLTEYRAAVAAAHDPAGYRALQEVLQTWRLLAAAYAKPDFQQRYEDIRDGVGETVSMDEVFSPRDA
jgi:hypothetical protein